MHTYGAARDGAFVAARRVPAHRGRRQQLAHVPHFESDASICHGFACCEDNALDTKALERVQAAYARLRTAEARWVSVGTPLKLPPLG